MNIESIEPNDEVKALLSAEGLLVSDLNSSQKLKLFGLWLDGTLAGVVGVECYQPVALLRSLVVRKSARELKYGQKLVATVESWCSANGISSLYLLTTTADRFFSKLDYATISREQAPTAIVNTTQFSDLCPDDAVLMAKNLSIP